MLFTLSPGMRFYIIRLMFRLSWLCWDLWKIKVFQFSDIKLLFLINIMTIYTVLKFDSNMPILELAIHVHLYHSI